mmetsp:Transcript_21446/g.52903  ORF Transcript_21446/g.52903 Transcript_21446/m.52903 type:complete len:104 (+) Transcript_21446:32-343(+)
MAAEAFQAGNEEFVEERWGAALQLFEKASELDPGKAEYLLHKAAALTKLGRIEDAIGACDSAMKAEPNNAKPYLRKGGMMHCALPCVCAFVLSVRLRLFGCPC